MGLLSRSEKTIPVLPKMSLPQTANSTLAFSGSTNLPAVKPSPTPVTTIPSLKSNKNVATLLQNPATKKKVIEDSNKLATQLLKSSIVEPALDVIEAPRQVYDTFKGNEDAQTPYQPLEVKGLPGLGGVESYTNRTKRYLEKGDNPGVALAKGLGEFLINEPVGAGFNAIAGGVIRPFIKNIGKEKAGLLNKVTSEIPLPQEVQRNSLPLSQADTSVQQTSTPGTQGERLESLGQTKTIRETPQDTSVRTGESSSLQQTLPPSESYVKELVGKQKEALNEGKKGLLAKSADFYNVAKRKLVDSNAPIEDLFAKTQKENKFTLLPQADISAQIDRALRAPTLAGQFARDNGLETIIKNVDSLDNLDQYLIAKQATNVAKKGIITGRNLAKDAELIRDFAPRYEKVAQEVNAYSQKLLDYSVDSGLISKELATSLKREYPEYVPLQRVFSEMEKGKVIGSKAVASLSKQSVVQKIKGSEREIQNPIQSLLEKTNDAFTQGEKNKAAKILADMRNSPGFEGMMRELRDGEQAVHTISYLDNGVKRTFETTKELADAAKHLNVQQLSILGKILAFPVRVAKLGITGINLPFVMANLVRDQMGAFINSKNALRTSVANPQVFLKALMGAVKHDDLYEEMVRAGAGGTSFDIARNQSVQTIEKIRSQKNLLSKSWYNIKNPGELVRAVEDIVGRSEEVTRLQQFKGTKDAMLAKGLDEASATIEAAKAARENTANFYRKGEWGTVMNAAFLYLNASIQGSRAFIRAFERAPKATAAKVATVLFFPMATITAWNVKDPERRKIYEDIADYEKENNFIIITPNTTKDEDGKWNVIKIPLPPGVGQFATPVRRGVEQLGGMDKVKAKEVFDSLIGAVSPVKPEVGSLTSTLTPQAIKPYLEGFANKNFFTGFNQVPRSLENVSPEYQVKDNTSGTARKLGNLMGVSPIKTEEWIKGTFGTVGSQALNASDLLLNKLGKIPEEQVGGQSIPEGIFGRFGKARGGQVENKESEYLGKVIQDQNDKREIQKNQAEELYKELKAMPTGAKERFDQILEEDPEIAKKIIQLVEDEKLGLTYADKQIKQLGVENEERAKHIANEFNKLKTKEEKAALWEELVTKKLITAEVSRQMSKYLNK